MRQRRGNRPDEALQGREDQAIADRYGLPQAVNTHAAYHHEVRLVQLGVEFYMIEKKPEYLIGDRTYNSDKLDEELQQEDRDDRAASAELGDD